MEALNVTEKTLNERASVTNMLASKPKRKAMPQQQDRMLQHFAYGHLPERLQAVSKPFGDLAVQIVRTLPSNAERTVALRKLLEAKDCAVRCLLEGETPREGAGMTGQGRPATMETMPTAKSNPDDIAV